MPEQNTPQEILRQINQRLNYFEEALREQIARIYAIEQKLGITPPPAKQPEPVAAPAQPVPPASPPPIDRAETPKIDQPDISHAATDSPSGEPKTGAFDLKAKISGKLASGQDLEAMIGGTWFNRIGIAAIILGVGYFLREAFRRGWIGPHGRVLIGMALGIGLLVAGERIRSRGYRTYAHGLSGGGIAILYLTIYAAFARYELISQLPAFALMSVVTATAVALAARYDALAIAVLGLIGGFLTPIFITTGKDNEAGLFSYITLLDVGVLTLAYFKRWRLINYLAFGATVLMAYAWHESWYSPEKLWTTILFFTVFFLIFAALPFSDNLINRRTSNQLDLSLLFSNALIYFFSCYQLLEPLHHNLLGLFAVIVSFFYFGLAYLSHRLNDADKLLLLSYLGVGSLFLTLSIPIQFDQHWVTISWAIEGAILTWIGVKTDNRATRYAAAAIFAIAFWHWAEIDQLASSYAQGQEFTLIFNKRGFSALFLISALAVSAWFHHQSVTDRSKSERKIFAAAYMIAANILALLWLSADINDYYNQAIDRLPLSAQGDPDPISSAKLKNSNEFSLTAFWTVYGVTGLAIAARRRSRLARYCALGLIAVTALKVLSVDLLYNDASWHRLIFNQTFFAVVLVIAAIGYAIYLFSHADDIGEKERRLIAGILTVAVNLIAIIGLSAEATGYFNARRYGQIGTDDFREMELAGNLSLSVIWTIYGGAMLVTGLWRGNKLLRVMAFILLAVTIVKVFFIDLASLDRVYRIISFIVLGVILLVVSYIYQHWQRRAVVK